MLGLGEVLLIVAIVVVLFGTRRVTEYFRAAGRAAGEFTRASERPAQDEALLVFLSSVMDRRIDDLSIERNALASIFVNDRLFSLWRFEDAPADDELEQSYLSKVEACHIFIILVGAEMTRPVEAEFKLAVEKRKPIVVLVKDQVNRSPAVEDFIGRLSPLNLRYKIFSSTEQLHREAARALYHIVIKYYEKGLSQKTYMSIIALLEMLQADDEAVDTSQTVQEYRREAKAELPRQHGVASIEDPVVIRGAKSSADLWRAKDQWIERHYPGAAEVGRGLGGFSGKVLEFVEIETPNGERKRLFFDISGFGK